VAPALRVKMPPWIVARTLQTLVVPLAGKRRMPRAVSHASTIPSEWVTLDKEFTRMSRMDDWSRHPQVGLGWSGRMRWATAGALINVLAKIEKDMRRVRYPLLAMHDPEDRITSFEGSKQLMALAATQDKKLLEAPGALHGVIHNAFDWVLCEMTAWMEKRSGGAEEVFLDAEPLN